MTRRPFLTLARPLMLALSLASTGALSSAVHAQPPVLGDDLPQDGAPPARPRRGGFRGQGAGPAGRLGRSQTPEQRAQRRALDARQMLSDNGFSNQALQDAVAAFVTDNENARQNVRDKQRALAEALDTQGTSNPRLAVLLKSYRDGVEADQSRHKLALRQLSSKIGAANNPRLDALLTLSGIIGDGPPAGAGGQGRLRGLNRSVGLGGRGGAGGFDGRGGPADPDDFGAPSGGMRGGPGGRGGTGGPQRGGRGGPQGGMRGGPGGRGGFGGANDPGRPDRGPDGPDGFYDPQA